MTMLHIWEPSHQSRGGVSIYQVAHERLVQAWYTTVHVLPQVHFIYPNGHPVHNPRKVEK